MQNQTDGNINFTNIELTFQIYIKYIKLQLQNDQLSSNKETKVQENQKETNISLLVARIIFKYETKH